MSKGEPQTKEAFEKLLAWLDPDRERAGGKYRKIQIRLIKIYAAKGCYDAEDLADEAINVVMRQIDWLIEHYEGDPALYFLGVARKIYLQHRKPKRLTVVPAPNPSSEEIERVCSCLDQCLQELSLDDRELVLQYHEKDKQEKIRRRKELAAKLGISRNALRIKVCHIHSRLRDCIERCLAKLAD